MKLSTEILQLITPEQAWSFRIIPYAEDLNSISLYSEIDSEELKESLEVLFGKKIIVSVKETEIIDVLLGKYYRKNSSKSSKIIFSGDKSDSFVYNILEEAKDIDSSDIHFEVFDEFCRIRMRIDGKLIERYIVPARKSCKPYSV